MNLGDFRTKTRRLIQDARAVRWSDALVDDAINSAYYEAQDRVKLVRPGQFDTEVFINLVTGTSRYSRPFFRPVLGYYRLSGSDYIRCNEERYDVVQPDAENSISRLTPPQEYTVVESGVFIYVYPVPDASLANGLKVVSDYDRALVAVTDNARVKVELHWRIPYGAASRLVDDDPTYPAGARARLAAEWNYIFGPEPEALKRLARVYPFRTMGRLTMEPALTTNARSRRTFNGEPA